MGKKSKLILYWFASNEIKKLQIGALKLLWALKLITGSSKSGAQGDSGPLPPPAPQECF